MQRKASHHVLEWSFIGAAIVLGTMACSFSLPDISNLPRLIVLAIALGVFFACSARMRLAVPNNIGSVCFAIFLLIFGLSTVWAVNKGEAVYDTARWCTATAIFLVVYNLYQKHPARMTIMLSRIAVAIIIPSVAVAVWQVLRLGDLVWDSRYGITSLYTHKGTFALLMLFVTLPIVLRLKLCAGKARAFYWLILAVVILVEVFLAVRTVMLACVVGVGVFLFSFIPFKPISKRKVFTATICVALLLGIVLIGGARFFASLPLGENPGDAKGIRSPATLIERHAIWNVTFRLSDNHPLLGVGAGNWKVCHPEVSIHDIFSVDVLDFSFVRPHNDILRVLSELGYPGVVLFLITLASLIVKATDCLARRNRQRRIMQLLLAHFASVLVAAMFDFPFDRTELLLWCSIILAILAGTTQKRHEDKHVRMHYVTMAMVAVAWLASVRMNSEKQYLTIISANRARKWDTMETAARNAQSPLCNLTPTGTPLAYYEAVAQEKQGKPAIGTFAKAIRQVPYHKQTLNELARLIYIVNHDADSAEMLFKKAIFVSPSFSYAYFNLANLYLKEGKPELAFQTLQSLDLDTKQKRIDNLVWQYQTGETALYYQYEFVLGEQQIKDKMISMCTR